MILEIGLQKRFIKTIGKNPKIGLRKRQEIAKKSRRRQKLPILIRQNKSILKTPEIRTNDPNKLILFLSTKHFTKIIIKYSKDERTLVKRATPVGTPFFLKHRILTLNIVTKQKNTNKNKSSLLKFSCNMNITITQRAK